MIWFRGEIVPDEAVKIGALDRTSEQGLGLFETFRTWNGHPTLLGRHLARMRSSARELGLTVDPGDWPDEAAVRELTPSLLKMCTRCDFTVASLMNRRSAMVLLEAPCATNSSTSISRADRLTRGERIRAISRVATAGARALSPAAAARMAATRSWGGASLSR